MENKIALITGASRGIGKSTALEFAKSGYTTLITYMGNTQAAQDTIEEIKKYNVQTEAFKFDISNLDETQESISKIIEKYGRIDVLVNNAGITRDDLIIRMSEDKWLDVINTNLNGVYFLSKPIIKLMMKQKSGSIVNVSSVVGIYGNIGQANYCAAKAGVIGLTKSLSKELGSRNIRVNAVAPGFIMTDMTKDLKNTEEITKFISLKRLGTAHDVASAIKFLAIENNYITGQVLEVDGGLII